MRLEELLRTHPPEAIERRRYEKIAKALGTRTSQQVSLQERHITLLTRGVLKLLLYYVQIVMLVISHFTTNSFS